MGNDGITPNSTSPAFLGTWFRKQRRPTGHLPPSYTRLRDLYPIGSHEFAHSSTVRPESLCHGQMVRPLRSRPEITSAPHALQPGSTWDLPVRVQPRLFAVAVDAVRAIAEVL
jgi:hypothetical protein